MSSLTSPSTEQAAPGAGHSALGTRFVHQYASAALEACWLVAATLAPLYLDLLRSQPTTPKGMLLQVLATMMALLWVVQRLTARGSGVGGGGGGGGPTPPPPPTPDP
jgi:hypothetical protein